MNVKVFKIIITKIKKIKNNFILFYLFEHTLNQPN